MHTAHEAGWINSMQGQVLDLTWLVDPGSVRAAILTGMFGLQPKPVTIEVVVWLAYAIPMTFVVFWPLAHRERGRTSRSRQRLKETCSCVVSSPLSSSRRSASP